VEVPSHDSGVRELLFLCYNRNYSTVEQLIQNNKHLLSKPVRGHIGDCPKVEHDESWEKLQEFVLAFHLNPTGEKSSSLDFFVLLHSYYASDRISYFSYP